MTLSYRKHRAIISAHLRKRSGWWARWQGRHQLKLEESLQTTSGLVQKYIEVRDTPEIVMFM